MTHLPQQISQMSPLKIAMATQQFAAKAAIMTAEPIAIIGMGCRLPGGADTPEKYWELLKSGTDAVSEMGDKRWLDEEHYDADPNAPGKMSVKHAGFLDSVDTFDAQFFGISPREAAVLDPQQRLLLEVSWEAIENAGIVPEKLHKTPTGVYIGITTSEYEKLCLQTAQNDNANVAYMGTGNDTCAAAGRLSYSLGLTGPSLSVNTACSSSLVATHLACESLRQRTSNMALAGGVNLTLIPDIYTVFSKAGMLSADGRCKTFDAAANGYVRGEGCGVVVLKRLADAVADGDNVLAVIRGSAVNQDGRSSGLTVPNGPSQQAVIRQALDNAGVLPSQVGYVEAHGTGTSLGDPIEVGALGEVFKGEREHPLLIGSAKTNIGHLESGAGAAGLIKTVLSLQHGEVPPNLHFNEPSPHIAWDDIQVEVATEVTPWPTERRLAGVSSFGYSGTNSHIVLEAAPEFGNVAPETQKNEASILMLSARTEQALADLANAYVSYLDLNTDVSLTELCATANSCRTQFVYRLAIPASSIDELRAQLLSYGSGEDDNLITGCSLTSSTLKTAFLFTGQGSQYTGMGRDLFETEAVFRDCLVECNEGLKPYLEHDLLDVLYPEKSSNPELIETLTGLINETAYTQPALFAVEYALANLWQSWGIKPDALLGHSVGEYAIACIAGVFSLEDALRLIATRGQLMQDLPHNGSMLSIQADTDTVNSAIAAFPSQVAIAAINGPNSVVISGATSAIIDIADKLKSIGINTRLLTVSHAFHSPLMEPMLDKFEAVAKEIVYGSPKLTIVSTLTGNVVKQEMSDAAYWVDHIRSSVDFNGGMAALEQLNCNVFVEMGAQPTLLSMGQHCISVSESLWAPSLRAQKGDNLQMMESLGQLAVRGFEVDWNTFHSDGHNKSLSLPTYPFQRVRHWVPEKTAAQSRSSDALRPLVDRIISSSLIAETIIETDFSLASLPYLKDHTVFEEYVVPGASHLAVLLSGAELMGIEQCQLESIVFPGPLVLPETGSRKVQTVLSPESDDSYSFQLISTAGSDDQEEPQTHATGHLSTQLEDQSGSVSLSDLQARCKNELNPDDLYQTASEQFIEFGDGFRWISGLWQTDGEALAQFSLPESIGDLEGYRIHPGLLDACFQTAGVTLDESGSSDTLLPFALKQLQFNSVPRGNEWWCHAVQVGASSWNIKLFDETGKVLVDLVEFEMRKAPRDALLKRQLADLLYDVSWVAQSEETIVDTSFENDSEGRWIIFADNDDIGAQLSSKLQAMGQSTAIVFDESHYKTSGEHSSVDKPLSITIDSQVASDYQQAMMDAFIEPGIACKGVIYLWGAAEPEDLLSDAQYITSGAMHIVQAMGHAGVVAPLMLVTKGSQTVENETSLNPAAATMWGFGRSLSIEKPELSCQCIDLSPEAQSDSVQSLLTEMTLQDAEDQVAWRNDTRYVARLAKHQDPAESALVLPSDAFRVQLKSYGSPDELHFATVKRRSPGPTEVEIDVAASALNFRDVLNSLGMLKEYYAEVLGIERAEDVPLGFECAGTIVAVGDEVKHLSVGDSVIANTEGSFASYVTVDRSLIARMPTGMNFEEAAGIPTAFLTAYYGINELAQLKQGDRILIQSAAGGVGQAAVQLAKAAGAEIFATASPGKWETLKEQGIKHVMNSRTLDFADQILALTDNKGVDVVLNSLNGDFINKSFDVLCEGGRFVEIGKIGVWSHEKVAEHRPDAIYLPFDLGEVTGEDTGLMTRMLDELVERFDAGKLKPLPHTSFPVTDIANAYRYMQQTKHFGKVVLNFKPEVVPTVRDDMGYLITGGLGGLGLQVALHLADQGARHLTLASRSGAATGEAKEVINTLSERGVNVLVSKTDVADLDDVAELLNFAQSNVPLAGIIHAAGVIDDAAVLKQTPQHIDKVMRPKLRGAWNLHQQSLDIPLEHFICFSSIASVMGSPGQTNYAAANAAVDGLMHQRRQQGLAGLSINWGPWDETGMAADMSFDGEGLSKIAPDIGVRTLTNLMAVPQKDRPTQVGVYPINWSTFMQQFPEGQIPPFVSEMVVQRKVNKVKGAATQKDGILTQLSVLADAAEQNDLLVKYIGEQLVQVLGLDASQTLPANQPWNELGLDSLMTVELKNRLDRSLRVTVPIETIMQEATTVTIAAMVLDKLDFDAFEGEAVISSTAAEDHIAALDADVEMLAKIPQTYVDVDEQKDRQVLIHGKWRSDFASCNYLGMDLHQDVIDSILPALDKWGVHPSWTRAVASPGLYPELEQELADLVGAPKALIFPSIHLLHMGVLPLLAGYGGVILKDNAAHHSIYEACLRSQADGIEWTEFAHNDLASLEEKLKRYRPEQTKIIAIDGVYSMSGEFPPLPEMVALAKQYNATIYLDDAHGIGVIGENPTEEMPYGYGGRGIVKYFDLNYEEDRIIYVGGLSKSFSSYGSFVTCFDQAMKSRLSLAGPFVFSGPSPVASLASALAGLKVNRNEGDEMRARVYQLTNRLVTSAKAIGYEVDNEHSFPIVGVVIGNVDEVTEACQIMWDHNILITPAIYPAVAMHRNLVRFSVTASNTEAEIDQAIKALEAVWEMVQGQRKNKAALEHSSEQVEVA